MAEQLSSMCEGLGSRPGISGGEVRVLLLGKLFSSSR